MKIALYNLTTTTKSGGIETFNRELASALAKRGHIVHIYGGKGDIIQNIPAGASIYTYPFIKREFIPDFGSRFRKSMERLSFGLFTLKDLIKGNYDYIYISKPFDIPVALLSSSYSKAKTIFSSGGTEFFPGYKYLAKKLDFFFACSEFNALQIEQYCGIKPLVLPNGVNTELFKPCDPDLKLKYKLQLTNNENIVISVCRLVGWKGIQYSIKAVAKLIEKGHSIIYLIIGDGEHKKDLETFTKNLHLSDRVRFMGNIRNTELPRYYSIADIAIYPSIANETFGISIAEAMACGMPVISTNVGGIPEIVHKGSGFLGPPKDDNFLAEAIKTLLLNDSLRKEMGNAGRKWIVENFSWDIVIEKFEEYINKWQ
jgi:glycosyltransferase involved in cell wall biosynthesis